MTAEKGSAAGVSRPGRRFVLQTVKECTVTTATRPDFTPHMWRAVRRLEAEWQAHGDLWHMFYREQARLAREARRTEFQWLALAEDIERERQRCKAERAAVAAPKPPVAVVKKKARTFVRPGLNERQVRAT